MHSRLSQAFLGTSLLALLACNGGGDSKAPTPFTGAGEIVSSVTPVFDPTKSNVPLPNILATATAADPITGSWVNPTTGAVTVGNRPAGVPITPPEALAYINLREVGGTNAVAGLNAPIYIQFSAPVDATTVTAANVKVFQISTDAAGTENAALGFSDVSGMFRYLYTAGGKDLLLFPNFPLFPGTRYLYVVTNRVKDTAGLAITSTPYFDALKGTIPLTGSFAALEAVRANVTSSGQILLSGYSKVMDDLITASATTTVTKRSDITVMGRFITTGAGYIPTDATSATTQTASRIPVESALRAFAAGSTLGGLPGKTWTNAITVPANTATAFYTFDRSGLNPPPDAYFAAVSGNAITSAPGISTVILGTINSADIGIDPALVRANPTSADMTSVAGAASPIAAVVQPFRTGTFLTSYYHVPRAVPFVYMAPTGVAPATGWPLVIFQHGITSQKESVFTIAQTLAAVGYAVVAIDMPLHGALQVTGHTTGSVWGQDFMAVGAPLTGRSNFQQGAFNLNRLELTVRAGGFAGLGAAKPSQATISFIGHSLGSMVGAYYLAGNTTMNTTAGQPPYTQTSLNADMKGYLSVPGGRTAYVIQNGAFGPTVDAGLAAVGVVKGSPSYHQFFLVTQTVIDPCDPATMTTSLISFDLGKLVLEHDAAQDLELKAGDVVTIFSQDEVRPPIDQQTKYVRLDGEVAHAGIYSVAPGETLRSLLHRAGGLTGRAYLYGSEFTRSSTRALQQARLNEYADRLEHLLDRNSIAMAGAASGSSQSAQQGNQVVAVNHALVTKIRTLRATGRIILEMSPKSRKEDDLPDLSLEDGDRLVIPSAPATIQVIGAVVNQNAFLYKQDAKVATYLRLSGGPSREADFGRSFILRADGSVTESGREISIFASSDFQQTRLYPGDTIVVPEKLVGPSAIRQLMNMTQILSQASLTAAMVNLVK